MKTFSKTDVGRKRETNQDYVYARTKPVGKLPNLFAVADGMGGHNAGDLASKCTVEILEREIEESTDTNIKDIIRQAIYKANEKIIEMAERDSKLEGMGTTLVVATIVHNMIYFANVGDSRLYLINHTITQLTKDHSLVEEMVRLGGIKPEEARNHPDKNIITRAIGAKEGVEPDFFEHSLKKGDIILMCSRNLLPDFLLPIKYRFRDTRRRLRFSQQLMKIRTLTVMAKQMDGFICILHTMHIQAESTC